RRTSGRRSRSRCRRDATSCRSARASAGRRSAARRRAVPSRRAPRQSAALPNRVPARSFEHPRTWPTGDSCASVDSFDSRIHRVNKPRLSFWQLFNMNYGFFGIQFGWGLQLANMSAVYERLGAHPDQVPLLWLAAPMTGLLVQPIIGALSDRTWGRLGRRRPYFLTGAILASIALFVMPTSSSLWMAASLLWVLDASINVSMEPFRAFVADKLDT